MAYMHFFVVALDCTKKESLQRVFSSEVYNLEKNEYLSEMKKTHSQKKKPWV